MNEAGKAAAAAIGHTEPGIGWSAAVMALGPPKLVLLVRQLLDAHDRVVVRQINLLTSSVSPSA